MTTILIYSAFHGPSASSAKPGSTFTACRFPDRPRASAAVFGPRPSRSSPRPSPSGRARPKPSACSRILSTVGKRPWPGGINGLIAGLQKNRHDHPRQRLAVDVSWSALVPGAARPHYRKVPPRARELAQSSSVRASWTGGGPARTVTVSLLVSTRLAAENLIVGPLIASTGVNPALWRSVSTGRRPSRSASSADHFRGPSDRRAQPPRPSNLPASPPPFCRGHRRRAYAAQVHRGPKLRRSTPAPSRAPRPIAYLLKTCSAPAFGMLAVHQARRRHRPPPHPRSAASFTAALLVTIFRLTGKMETPTDAYWNDAADWVPPSLPRSPGFRQFYLPELFSPGSLRSTGHQPSCYNLLGRLRPPQAGRLLSPRT